MKAIVKFMLLSLITTLSYSQDKQYQKMTTEELLKKMDMPEVVVKKAGKDLFVYVRDSNVDPEVTKLQNSFIDYNIENKPVGLENNFYTVDLLLTFESENGKLLATYNEKGKLISVVENYKNVILPNDISVHVYKEYPGWQIVSDKYNYSQENGEIIKKEYRITMTKENKTKKISVNPVGKLVASR